LPHRGRETDKKNIKIVVLKGDFGYNVCVLLPKLRYRRSVNGSNAQNGKEN
jgi:hypothetical protein